MLHCRAENSWERKKSRRKWEPGREVEEVGEVEWGEGRRVGAARAGWSPRPPASCWCGLIVRGPAQGRPIDSAPPSGPLDRARAATWPFDPAGRPCCRPTAAGPDGRIE